nr:MAG TPA: head tail connector [Caudoviricetes sp.]
MIVSYEIALQHLRASDGTPESDLIKLFIGAASEAACEFLGRKVYEDADALSAAILDGSTGADPILLNDSIRAAVLLILGHLYANREDSVVGLTAIALPMGSRSLLQPFRVGVGV